MVTQAQPPTIAVAGRALPPERVVLPVEIMVGRENPTAQPDANSMSFSYVGDLPPEFVRGAPVNGTLLGFTLAGWDDVWTDLWSAEESTPGLVPPPTAEGFSQWYVSFDGPPATVSYEDGGATLVTSWQEVTT
jgi:hypothetical protein